MLNIPAVASAPTAMKAPSSRLRIARKSASAPSTGEITAVSARTMLLATARYCVAVAGSTFAPATRMK
jgi:hypothetical protein